MQQIPVKISTFPLFICFLLLETDLKSEKNTKLVAYEKKRWKHKNKISEHIKNMIKLTNSLDSIECAPFC